MSDYRPFATRDDISELLDEKYLDALLDPFYLVFFCAYLFIVTLIGIVSCPPFLSSSLPSVLSFFPPVFPL